MANRRMFAKTITESDAFMDMPLTTQALYFHLGMNADDDGFVNSPKRVQRFIGAADDDMILLLAKGFILKFESGVIVIKHWRINNLLKSDRYSETTYTDERAMLELKENKAYTFINSPSDQALLGSVPNGFQMGSKMDTKYSIVEDSIVEDIYTSSTFVSEVIAYLNEKTGKNFKPSSAATIRHINARRNEGYNIDDFKRVIDTKVLQWGHDSKMAGYLRPQTLFGTKFESYLNEGVASNDYSDFRVR